MCIRDRFTSYKFNDQWAATNKSAFIKGYDTDNDLPLIDIPPFTTTNSISYDNPKWNRFNATLTSELVFEQNEFPDEYNYDVNIADRDPIFVDLGPPPAYHLVHFTSEMTLNVNDRSKLNARLSVNNIFNTTYRNYLNRFRFFADDLGTLSLIHI